MKQKKEVCVIFLARSVKVDPELTTAVPCTMSFWPAGKYHCASGHSCPGNHAPVWEHSPMTLIKAPTSPAGILTLKSCTHCSWNSILRISPLHIPALTLYKLATVVKPLSPRRNRVFATGYFKHKSNTEIISCWLWCLELLFSTSSLQPLPASRAHGCQLEERKIHLTLPDNIGTEG